MKLLIEITETKQGDIAVRMRREAGLGSDLETAYADGIVDDLKARIPVIGQKLGGKGMLGGSPDQQ